MSVKPPRSIRALPTPTHASSARAASCWGKTPMSETGTPHSVTPTANQAPSRRVSTSKEAAREPRTAPAPMAADSRPTPDSPVSQQVDRDHDGQDREGTTDQGLRHSEAHDQREVTVASDGSDALGRGVQQAVRLGGGARGCFVVQSKQQDCRPQRGGSGDGEYRGHPGQLEEQRCQQGAHECGHGVQQPAYDVGAGQLEAGVAQRRDQRGVCRSVERGSDGRQHRQRVDDLGRAGQADDQRGRAGGDPAKRRDQDEDPLATAPVGQRREQRSQDRRGRHAEEPDQADGRRAAVAVGHDPQAHGERPLGRPRAQKAQLGATQARVPRVAAESCRGLAQPALGQCSHGVALDLLSGRSPRCGRDPPIAWQSVTPSLHHGH